MKASASRASDASATAEGPEGVAAAAVAGAEAGAGGSRGRARDPAAPALDQSCMSHLLGYQVTRANLSTRKLFARHIGGPYRLSPVEFTILMLVAHNRDATQKQLCQALAVSAPNLTALLDRLGERRLLIRIRNESDRRSQHVRLTRDGLELVREAREVSLTMEHDLLRHLSQAEFGILIELLQKVASGRRA